MAKTLLLVEDDFYLLQVYQQVFIDQGYTVYTADNGEKGLDTALEKHPDIIVLDYNLPKMDGMIVLQNLRKDVWGKSAKIILLTNVTSDDKINEGIAAKQLSNYLIKSETTPEELFKKVEEVLQEQDSH